MAGKGNLARLLSKHRTVIIRDLNVDPILQQFVRKGLVSKREEKGILEIADLSHRTEKFIDVLSGKGLDAFHEFCTSLEKFAPHLLTGFLLDNPGNYTIV